MRRADRTRMPAGLALLLALAAPALADAAPERPERPNIVLILADDQGYSDLGCYGAEDLRTPNLDRMAREGTRFTSFYVAQAVCTASRAALLTGCYANRVGLSGALNHTSPVGIDPRETLLAEQCQRRGYATAIFGKWHLGHQRPFLPTRNGFDEFSGIPYSNDNSPLHPVTRGIQPLPWYEGDSVVAVDPDQSQFTRRLTERAVDFLERNRDRPFFLYVPHIMPHVPIFASEGFRGKSGRGLFGDVIEELDWSVGEILAAIDRLGLEGKTLVLFASDNGPFLSYGEHAGTAHPLREGKLTTFEGGVRVPFLARWPGHVPAGRECDELVSAMDLNATIASLVGAEPPAEERDGIDLSPLLLGEPGAKGREAFWYYSGSELQAVRLGDWKLHLPHEYLTVAGEPGRGGKPSNYGKLEPVSIEQSGIRGIASRHGYRFESIGPALYNLKDDPGETTDVAAEHPDVVRRLQEVAAEARAELGDSLTGVTSESVRPCGDVRPALPSGVRRVANLAYNDPDSRTIPLDLYLPDPAPAHPLPVLVWIHGGGWTSGSKENCPLAWMAAEGFAVASIDYRLIPEATWPAQVEDCRTAIRWLRSHAGDYHLDADHIGVAGGSAGGHLAALLGTLDPPEGEAAPSRVQAVCDLYGPSDLLTMPANLPGPRKTDADLAKSNGARLLGGIVRDRRELAERAGALHQVSAGDAPFLIVHGDRDPQVPLDQSVRLHEALRRASVPSTLRVVEGGGHGGRGFDSPELRALILDFFREHLDTHKD